MSLVRNILGFPSSMTKIKNNEMLVSVIMPAYNAEKYIAAALDSIFTQTHKYLEVIVVNDGSTDTTADILAEYKLRYGEKLVVIHQKNQGQVVAKNNGLKVSGGALLAFLDSDDLWAPGKIEEQVKLITSEPRIGLCYTEATLIDQNGEEFDYRQVDETYQGKCFEKLIMRNNITASSVMIKRECLDKVGYFDETLRTCENWDLWLRISIFYELAYIRLPLAFYRVHGGHMSGNLDKMRAGKLAVVKKNQGNLSDNLYREALFGFHIGYARDYLWQCQVGKARRDLIGAMKLKPGSVECYKLFLKSFLGSKLLAKIKSQAS